MQTIPYLSKQSEMETNKMFRQILNEKIMNSDVYRNTTPIEELEELLTLTPSKLSEVNDDIELIHLYLPLESVDNLIYDSFRETQAKMDYYKDLENSFPELAKISLDISYKLSNERLEIPWSEKSINNLNAIATYKYKNGIYKHWGDQTRVPFDYNKLKKFLKN
jgi:hypothetical protein